jgi:hypothetical protein
MKIGPGISYRDSPALAQRLPTQLLDTLDGYLCDGTVNLPTWYVSQALVRSELRPSSKLSDHLKQWWEQGVLTDDEWRQEYLV